MLRSFSLKNPIFRCSLFTLLGGLGSCTEVKGRPKYSLLLISILCYWRRIFLSFVLLVGCIITLRCGYRIFLRFTLLVRCKYDRDLFLRKNSISLQSFNSNIFVIYFLLFPLVTLFGSPEGKVFWSTVYSQVENTVFLQLLFYLFQQLDYYTTFTFPYIFSFFLRWDLQIKICCTIRFV